jgi:superfamily II DNA or RNA helicase
MALSAIAARKQPALIIVHTKELLQQWIDRASQFLNLDPSEFGIVGNGKRRIGDRLTIGIVNSIYPIADEIKDHFGFVVVDECHHCPSRTFTEAVSAFDCRYMLGLSATPYRRDGLSKLIYWYLGGQAHAVDKAQLVREGSILKPELVTRQTNFISEHNLAFEYSKGISELTLSTSRNALIADDVAVYLRDHAGPVLVLSDRTAHCQTLQAMLMDKGVNAAILTGNLSNGKRKAVVERIRTGEVQAICATGSLVGEGFDLPSLNALFLVTPIKFSGRVLQYVGRVLRPAPGKDRAVIFDYVDSREPVLMASAKARMKVYQQAA